MKIVAHRGLSGLHPENTLEAFEAALAFRPEAMELDVQLTRDGQVVIFHDETLDRMGRRSGWLKDFTYDELKALPVRIPLLEDYFRLIESTEIDTFVEFKNSFVLYPGLEEKAIGIAARFGRLDDCIFYSASHVSVLRAREEHPGLRVCFPINDWILDMAAYCERWQIKTTIPYHLALTEEIVADFHARGIEVYPWTVDEPEEMRRMAALGADGLLTNRADILRSLAG